MSMQQLDPELCAIMIRIWIIMLIEEQVPTVFSFYIGAPTFWSSEVRERP